MAGGRAGRCDRCRGRRGRAAAAATVPIMLVAAAVCPCPPLLVPEVAAGAAPELDAAARRLLRRAGACWPPPGPTGWSSSGPPSRPGAARTRRARRGSFRGFGVDLDVRLGPAAAADTPRRTRAAAVPRRRAWLLRRAGWSAAPVEGLGVGEPLAAERCVEAGREIAGAARSGSRCW